MSIIGVVAALTIPSLVTKNREKETVVRVKKVYSVLSDAFNLAVIDYGSPTGWNSVNVLKNYLNVARDCSGFGKPCFAERYIHLNSEIVDINYTKDIVLTADAMGFYIFDLEHNCDRDRGNGRLKEICGEIYVDINSHLSPNKAGIDLFSFWITKTSIIPRGTADATYIDDTLNGHKRGLNYTAWVIQRENLDYLHSGVSWDK